MFWITKEALKHMPNDGAIINTTSINAFKGHPTLYVAISTEKIVCEQRR